MIPQEKYDELLALFHNYLFIEDLSVDKMILSKLISKEIFNISLSLSNETKSFIEIQNPINVIKNHYLLNYTSIYNELKEMVYVMPEQIRKAPITDFLMASDDMLSLVISDCVTRINEVYNNQF